MVFSGLESTIHQQLHGLCFFPSFTVFLSSLKSMAWHLCEQGENLILQGIMNHRHINCVLPLRSSVFSFQRPVGVTVGLYNGL